ncbi:hypothetical protein B0I35DRAFT_413173 [Stachybotrys elegans]|uniref:Uncharacterized protein n=1 Tax=Stachybotrys elegans TaxID=80388 RepID=A0A8K0SM37_9HYPO|nr:hypothetical protein B0I35DRAFT_413173 [Stachybotrys elegans]
MAACSCPTTLPQSNGRLPLAGACMAALVDTTGAELLWGHSACPRLSILNNSLSIIYLSVVDLFTSRLHAEGFAADNFHWQSQRGRAASGRNVTANTLATEEDPSRAVSGHGYWATKRRSDSQQNRCRVAAALSEATRQSPVAVVQGSTADLTLLSQTYVEEGQCSGPEGETLGISWAYYEHQHQHQLKTEEQKRSFATGNACHYRQYMCKL